MDDTRSATGDLDLQLLNVDNIGDCTADPYGFGDGAHHVAFVVEYAWQYLYSTTKDWRIELPLMGITRVARSMFPALDYYRGINVVDDEGYATCFWWTWPVLLTYGTAMSVVVSVPFLLAQIAIRISVLVYQCTLVSKQLVKNLIVA